MTAHIRCNRSVAAAGSRTRSAYPAMPHIRLFSRSAERLEREEVKSQILGRRAQVDRERSVPGPDGHTAVDQIQLFRFPDLRQSQQRHARVGCELAVVAANARKGSGRV